MNEKHPELYDHVVAINVDIQNDFCPGGALPVPDSDAVVPVMNQVNEWVRDQYVERHAIGYPPHDESAVVFTADWHPEDTKHFARNGGPWPVHCVRYKAGAAFHDDLEIKDRDIIAHKGMSKEDDGYSGWSAVMDGGRLYQQGDGRYWPTIDTVRRGVESLARIFDAGGDYSKQPRRVALVIGGLATDYCVKATVLDALKEKQDFPTLAEKLGVYVVEDAIRAVDINPGDGDAAIAEMKAAGAKFVKSSDIIAGNVIEVRRES